VSSRQIRLFREPLIQFLLIGACIYGAYALFANPQEDFRDSRVHVDSNRINALISEWESRWKRPPTRTEIDGVIQSYIREDVLYKQAVAMGLNEDDPVTRRRMAQKLEFLTSDLADMVQPTEPELETYFEEHQAVYQQPDVVTFRQVYFNPDKRGEATLNDAENALVQLQAVVTVDALLSELGDSSMIQNEFSTVTEAQISRQMGDKFAQSVMNLEAGQWNGPVLSGYGVHLVYVDEYQAAAATGIDDVKPKVLADWQEQQRETFNLDFLNSLKQRYEIIIDEIPADRILEATDGSVSDLGASRSPIT
jgi:hypothetical protein